MIQTLLGLVLLAFPALVIVGGVQDLVSYRIPNWVSLALIGSFALAASLALAAGVAPSVLGLDVAAGVVGLLIGMFMFARGWIGGGDAKLFAAAALWLGWPAGQTYFFVTALSGGALAVLLLALRAAPLRPLVLAGPTWFARLGEPGESVPYGVAIAVGALAAFPQSALVQAAHLV